MRGYATNAATDAGFMAPCVGESMVIAGVLCTFDGKAYAGAHGAVRISAHYSDVLGEWCVGVSHRDGVCVARRAADLDVAAAAALHDTAAVAVIEAFLSAAATAVRS